MRSRTPQLWWYLLPFWFFPTAPIQAAEPCAGATARFFMAKGEIQIIRNGQGQWQPVGLQAPLCEGDRLRVGKSGSAAVVLPDRSQIRLSPGTVVSLVGIDPEKPAWINMLEGFLHFFSHKPQKLTITTPIANAGPEGTEFVLGLGPKQASLWVFDGHVRFSNPAGSVLVSSGEQAEAETGKAPQKRIIVRPRDAVEWALYYPPLIDIRKTPQMGSPMLQRAQETYQAGRISEALETLDRVPEKERNGGYLTLRAGLLLSVARVKDARSDIDAALNQDPSDATAHALLSVIAVVQNKDEGLDLAHKAAQIDPQSSVAQIALSYAHQAAFDLDLALEDIKHAVTLAPEDALIHARLAELELSRGHLDAALNAAKKATRLNPELARTQTILGFAYLTQIETDEAKRAFSKAIALDSADPLPRLGAGLAKIREGELNEGTHEIEHAVSLDPSNSLVRSYLGKAYFEEKRGGLASSEFALAKQLDPNDPTPWFYDAIHKQTTNRPVEALHDLQKAIELNDNRAVYRSRLLLDDDLAARSASLGRIYNDLGFQQLGLVEGWKSVNTDPSNYSAHRLLADNYAGLPRHEIARVSELLQSQLLQPINITPVQPNLAESNLLILEGSGPSDASFNEFNPLFTRNRLALQASGVFGSNDTLGDEVTQSGVWDKFSYSLGQFHLETDGFRENNDLAQDLYNAFVQFSATNNTSFQAEVRHSDTESGDVTLRFQPNNFFGNLRRDITSDTVRFGYHYNASARSDLIASAHILDRTESLRNRRQIGQTTINNTVEEDEEGYNTELQYLLRASPFNLVTGASYYDVHRIRENVLGLSIGPRTLRPTVSETDVDIQHTSLYAYSQITYPTTATWTIGVSTDFYDDSRDFDPTQVNPKFGLIWNPNSTTTLRAAAFRVLKRLRSFNQAIEPTQVAGFNQFFDDVNGTDSTRYGIAIDHRFFSTLFGGVELSARDLDAPFTFTPLGTTATSIRQEQRDEQLHRAYLNWVLNPNVVASIEYFYENLDRELTPESTDPTLPKKIQTHQIPLGLSLFHPSGFFANLKATYIDQTVEFPDVGGNTQRDDDQFWITDLSFGYRFPKRWGIFRITIRNLFDEEFKFQDTDLAGEPRVPFIQPEQAIFSTLTLAF